MPTSHFAQKHAKRKTGNPVYIRQEMDASTHSGPEFEHCIGRGIRMFQQIRRQVGPHQHRRTLPKENKQTPD